MKAKKRMLRSALFLAVGFHTLSLVLSGQAVDQPANTTNSPAASETDQEVVLSPFVVSTDKDVGFVAASSLAGGKLAGDLRDTPAAYSVLTREFIDALGLNDLVAASEWTVNSVNAQGAGDGEIFGAGYEINSRGVSVGTNQRNFFPLNVNPDSYNLDRYDYARGPNAILFGQGSFGGTSNSVTKRAQFSGKNKTSLRLQYGSWDQRRVTVDDNRILNDKVALRINALWQDNQGWRDFELETKKAITLAATWKLGRRTELLVEGEVGEIIRNNPPTFLTDSFTGWNGTRTFSTLQTNAIVPSSTIMNAEGVTRIGSDTSPRWVYSSDMNMTTVQNIAGMMATIGGNANGSTPVGGVLLPSGGAVVNLNTRPINEALNAAPWRFDRAIAGSRFRVPDSSFAISTLEPTNKQTYRTYSIFLRNQFGSNFFMETALNTGGEDRRTNYLNVRSLNAVAIDLNQNLPTGGPNPGFLDAYGEGQRSRGSFGNKTADARLALAYQLQRSRLGSYIFNLMGGLSTAKWYQRIESMRVFRQADVRQVPYNDPVYYRYYWNSPSRDLPEITQATLAGTTYPVKWIGDSQRATDISYTDTDAFYLQGAIKARYFSDRLHVFGAFRHDDMEVKRTINDFYTDYAADWNGVDYMYRPDAPEDYLTLPDIRPRNGTTRMANTTTGRYQDDYNPPLILLKHTTYSGGAVFHLTKWMSVFANYATSFTPSTSQLRLDGSIVSSPVSKGYDMGLRFYLLKNRVNVSLNKYHGEETDQPFEISFTNNLQDIGLANVIGDLSPEGYNQRGLPIVPRQAFDLRDRVTDGYELEVTANLTKKWRLSGNYAAADGEQNNAWRDVRTFIDKWKDTMKQAVIDSGNVFNASGIPVADGGPTAERIDASAARNAWINIFQNQVPNIVSDPQMIPGLTERSANLFTDYEFSDGWLRGVKVGAGINYRGKKVIGFRGGDTIQDPAQPTNYAAAIDDPSVSAFTPVYSDPYTTTTATVSYSFKLKGKNSLSLQLRVSNLFDTDIPVYTGSTTQRPPDGDYTKTAARVATPTQFRYQVPRSYQLTASYSF